MKVLIITENQDLSLKISTLARNFGADIIIYKWFLKALDNLEEIQPDIVILSSSEYPRLWKTLAQFSKSGIGGNNIHIYLYEEKSLSDEDQEKYSELGISGAFSQINETSLAFLKQEEDLPVIGEILFSMPKDGKIVSGMVNSFNQNELKCTLDFTEDLSEVHTLPYVNMRINSHISSCTAQIKQFDKNKNRLLLEVKNG